jgi:transposase
MDTKLYFLKSWAYYQLQEMVIYKAAHAGIKVEFVKPQLNSQTCPTCKNVDKEQRDKQHFTCSNVTCVDYNIEKDVDIVDALNILGKESGDKIKKGKKKVVVQ